MPIIPILGRPRQEDLGIEASLGYTVKLCFNKQTNNNKTTQKEKQATQY
jgi:hypothetical protein